MHPDSKLRLGIDSDGDKSCSALRLGHRGEVMHDFFVKLSVVLSVLRKLVFALFLFRLPTGVISQQSTSTTRSTSHASIVYITKPPQQRHLLLSLLLNAISCTMAGTWDGLSASHPTKAHDSESRFVVSNPCKVLTWGPLHPVQSRVFLEAALSP
jgi:hypothetical protein